MMRKINYKNCFTTIWERTCIRACLGRHKHPGTNFRTMLSNKKIYNQADIPRIDSFIVKLTRNHINQALKNDANPLIKEPYMMRLDIIDGMRAKGFLPPGAFPRLDQLRYIQNDSNIPIYHIKRHMYDKRLTIDKDLLKELPTDNMVLSTAFPMRDIRDRSQLNTVKYPWLKK